MAARGILVLLVLIAAQSAGAQTRLQVDARRSRIAFSVPVVGGFGSLTGQFTDFDVAILYNDADVAGSSLKARISAASIETGSELVDVRLRGREFLAVDRYPEILFESRRVVRWGDQYLAIGDLTLRGVSKKIGVSFRIVTAHTGGEGRPALGARAQAIVKWEEYAVGSGWKRAAIKSLLGEEVTVDIELWARPAAPSPQRGIGIPPRARADGRPARPHRYSPSQSPTTAPGSGR